MLQANLEQGALPGSRVCHAFVPACTCCTPLLVLVSFVHFLHVWLRHPDQAVCFKHFASLWQYVTACQACNADLIGEDHQVWIVQTWVDRFREWMASEVLKKLLAAVDKSHLVSKATVKLLDIP